MSICCIGIFSLISCQPSQSNSPKSDDHAKLGNEQPVALATSAPSGVPTIAPTVMPEPTVTPVPIPEPTVAPTVMPEPTVTPVPIPEPTVAPTVMPEPTVAPTVMPEPTVAPTVMPEPTVAPTVIPEPTVAPTVIPEPTVTPVPAPTPGVGESAEQIQNKFAALPKRFEEEYWIPIEQSQCAAGKRSSKVLAKINFDKQKLTCSDVLSLQSESWKNIVPIFNLNSPLNICSKYFYYKAYQALMFDFVSACDQSNPLQTEKALLSAEYERCKLQSKFRLNDKVEWVLYVKEGDKKIPLLIPFSQPVWLEFWSGAYGLSAGQSNAELARACHRGIFDAVEYEKN